MAPCARGAPGGDARPGVVARAENPVGSLRRFRAPVQGMMFCTAG